ncbi:hypothetical protein ACP70R_008750 [Stipagrostis hirtigluma subsp. patula]
MVNPFCLCSPICNLIGTVILTYTLWGIYFRPYAVRPFVDGAALATFDLFPVVHRAGHNTTALRYDLKLNMSFFSDHRIYNIRFEHLTAGLYYNGTKIGPSDDTLPSFKLRTRRHRTVYPVLQGRARNVSEVVAEAFVREREQGQFNIDVRVKTTLTYRWWPETSTYYYEYHCWLQFTPPSGNGTPALTGGVKCGGAKWWMVA